MASLSTRPIKDYPTKVADLYGRRPLFTLLRIVDCQGRSPACRTPSLWILTGGEYLEVVFDERIFALVLAAVRLIVELVK
jgi:hypothetical protein